MVDRDASLKAADKFLRQGQLDAAIKEYVRLVRAQPREWNAINALGDLYVQAGDAERAVSQFTRVADHLYTEGFFAKAAAVYKKSLRAKADDEHTLLRLADISIQQRVAADTKLYLRQLADARRERGNQEGAAEALARLAAFDDTDADALLARADQQLAAGDSANGRATLTRLVAIAPDRYPSVVQIAARMLAAGQSAAAYGCIEVAVDAALLESQFERAAAILHEFLTHGRHEAALEKLVEVCREAGFEGRQRMAEAELELLRAPADTDTPSSMHPDAVVDVTPDAPAPTMTEQDLQNLIAQARRGAAAAPSADSQGLDETAPDLDTVFAQMRATATQRDTRIGGAERYERALETLHGGDMEAAIEQLQALARTPLLRFEACSQLGRIFANQGDLAAAVEWFERAADAPAPTVEDGFAVLYDLAVALERMGEADRALAVLLEINADAPEYRDVPQRIRTLSKAQPGSSRG
jgi:tetratricopeptide (TPR) repeat protein